MGLINGFILKNHTIITGTLLLSSIFYTNHSNAQLVKDAPKPPNIENSFEKYAEIKLANGQSTVKVMGTINTTHEGFEKFSNVANNLLETVSSEALQRAFNGKELFLINVGDYPEVIPYTQGRSTFLIDVGENYRGGGVGNMIYQSEEFICKPGVITRYHKGVNDTAARRWDNPIHEIGHWIEIHGNYRNSILNLADFNKLPTHWRQGGIDEVFTILVTAWFDAQYSYTDMPQNREQFKSKFPNYYSLFQSVFKESVRDIGQYCANEQELKAFDRLFAFQKPGKLKERFGKYPKSIISKTGNKVPNAIQKHDSMYKLDYSYVIDDNICSEPNTLSSFAVSSAEECSQYCDKNLVCHRFGFNIKTNVCKLYNQSTCSNSTELNPNTADEFQYIKINQASHTQKSNKLTAGEKLKMGEFLCSSNKKYMFILQKDGNVCLYEAGFNNQKNFVWCGMTSLQKSNTPFGLIMQTDGNLALYKDIDRVTNYAWSTQSNGVSSGYTALLKNNRNFVIYDGFYREVWSSHTAQNNFNQTSFQFNECN